MEFQAEKPSVFYNHSQFYNNTAYGATTTTGFDQIPRCDGHHPNTLFVNDRPGCSFYPLLSDAYKEAKQIAQVINPRTGGLALSPILHNMPSKTKKWQKIKMLALK